MSFAQSLRTRREAARTNRAINKAINNAATPALRDELILVAQRQFARNF
ncbi:hypothetical protein GCM10027418_06010 [Mariniluteicoccus endophyticus]